MLKEYKRLCDRKYMNRTVEKADGKCSNKQNSFFFLNISL